MSDFKFVNLTPHSVKICDNEGNITHVFEPSGTVARVSTIPSPHVSLVGGVPVSGGDTFGPVVGLPDIEDDTYFIVSGVVGSHPDVKAYRPDVLVPATAPADKPLRNEKGHIIAVKHLKSVG